MLHNPQTTLAGQPLRERLLVYGGEKSGKTSGWLSIALLAMQTGADAKFYVIDGDCTTDKFLYDKASPYLGLTNVIVEKAYRWPQYTAAMQQFLKLARPQDWIILDMATGAWQAVQSHYYREAYGKTIEEVILERKKASDDDAGMKDFQAINPIYFDFIIPWSVETSANVYAAAAEKSSGYRESKQVSALFPKDGRAEGSKPDAQNKLGYMVDTIIRLRAAIPGQLYVGTTVGDRGGRTYWQGQPVTNFAMDYLIDVAGWSLA